MAQAALLQAICAREHLGPEDVAGDFGESYAASEDAMIPPQVGEMTALWMELCASKEIDQIIADFEYRIESGSARKPNKAAQVETASQVLQTLLPVLMPQYQMTGDPTQVNVILREYLKAIDWNNPEELLFPTAEEQMQQQMMLQQQQMQMQQQMGMVPPQQTIPMGASA